MDKKFVNNNLGHSFESLKKRMMEIEEDRVIIISEGPSSFSSYLDAISSAYAKLQGAVTYYSGGSVDDLSALDLFNQTQK